MSSLKQDNEVLHQIVLSELKVLGVKVPKIKKLKSNILKQESSVSEKESKLFGVNLNDQEWVLDGEHTLPKFISMATTYLQKFTDKEGLFRKAGNVARQRKLRAKLEKGESLEDSDPNDVACLLKQWLRELPEPLIPFYLQNLFIRCQCLDTEKNCISACLLTCLLLPPDHLHSLRHLLHFLADIASNSNKSRMCTYNLALVMAPNIFSTNDSIEKVSSYMNNLVYQHTAVMKILIENSDKIGKVPQSISDRQSHQQSELTASLDLFPATSKSKRRLRNDIISGFRKLVRQNETAVVDKNSNSEENGLKTPFPKSAFKRKADPDLESMSPTKKQALSENDLDSNSLTVTSNVREIFPTTDKISNGHTRRKSLAALLLKRKTKQRSNKNPQGMKLSIFDDKSTKEQKNCQERLEKYQENINKFPVNNVASNGASRTNENNTSSECLTDIKQVDPQLLPLIDCEFKKLSIESNRLHLKNELATSSTQSSNAADVQHEIVTLQNEVSEFPKTRIIRQEMICVKRPVKIMSSYPGTEVRKVRSKGSIKTCSHTQNSECNTKCDKNKTTTDGRRLSERKHNERSLVRVKSGPVRMSHNTKLLENENFHFLKDPSPVSIKASDGFKSIPTQSDTSSQGEMPVPQSLDVSLSLMLQNFCLSPPSDQKEITLSIGITSNKSNPELKLNISQKDISPSTPSGMVCKSSRRRASRGRSRRRLSSNSDSRILRPKKLYTSRPKSFSGNHLSCKLNVQKPVEHSKLSTPCSRKIPLVCIKNEPLSTSESVNDSCFKTPNGSFMSSDSVFHMNESHYLSAVGTPDEACSKRESISRILKENSGHVKEKVSLYDSRFQSQNSFCSSPDKNENGRLLRAYSEKYPRHRRKTNLCNTNSYGLSKRSGSLRNKCFKYISPPPKFVLTNLDTPSPTSKQTKEN